MTRKRRLSPRRIKQEKDITKPTFIWDYNIDDIEQKLGKLNIKRWHSTLRRWYSIALSFDSINQTIKMKKSWGGDDNPKPGSSLKTYPISRIDEFINDYDRVLTDKFKLGHYRRDEGDLDIEVQKEIDEFVECVIWSKKFLIFHPEGQKIEEIQEREMLQKGIENGFLYITDEGLVKSLFKSRELTVEQLQVEIDTYLIRRGLMNG